MCRSGCSGSCHNRSGSRRGPCRRNQHGIGSLGRGRKGRMLVKRVHRRLWRRTRDVRLRHVPDGQLCLLKLRRESRRNGRFHRLGGCAPICRQHRNRLLPVRTRTLLDLRHGRASASGVMRMRVGPVGFRPGIGVWFRTGIRAGADPCSDPCSGPCSDPYPVRGLRIGVFSRLCRVLQRRPARNFALNCGKKRGKVAPAGTDTGRFRRGAVGQGPGCAGCQPGQDRQGGRGWDVSVHGASAKLVFFRISHFRLPGF